MCGALVQLLLCFQVLFYSCCAELVKQKDVPAILFSHKLSPGMLKYQENYESAMSLPSKSFDIIAEELLRKCNSDAIIFVNQPGLCKLDFEEFEDEFKFLRKYIKVSSTSLKFEKVSGLHQNTFQNLIDITSKECNIDRFMTLRGNNTDDFEPYIDTNKRIIVINYPPLPENDYDLRRKHIMDYDLYLRTILAQIPSPYQTVIYTSLERSLVPKEDVMNNIEVFPGLFEDLAEEEKNDRLKDEPPAPLNKFRTLYPGMSTKYISIFDSGFLEQNGQLLKAIFTSLVGYIIYQTILYVREPKKSRPNDKHPKRKSPEKPVTKTEKKAESCEAEKKRD
ncbi:hypothetical protein KAFR_0D04940 [Kazachstania africana CBS 2517]|uniref:Protein BIG1 n=1 Tax=Kazachstania africana (strain ATCC 22294 / BCRC 22015 / CBS 2517 / CECT 1963 / NBRC 1671 / NRRL Y-8276) TaxID=1071382 RepID=H2AUU1_KAZAF|nr:hypothetical protein KAFR_0D04940 [Kazachstania africana CBS 2517]CCF58141.1 hypothetical protein KAFR_0D04940 [Kazachstania africana CBS 2517]